LPPCALEKQKSPFSFRENGLSGPVSLAAFVERPQAEHQIGAGVDYSRAAPLAAMASI
jgi:hypothetical protein